MNYFFYTFVVILLIRFLVGITSIGKGDKPIEGSTFIKHGSGVVFKSVIDSILLFGSMGFFAGANV
ncbi:hypothetical protein [Vibrio phage VEN]|uniref:Uncharacterized protein n=1 Tax=Vibrio phage VEN TaxID=2059879 RepID=A0A2H5BMY4_9CAUD|nr:hypothetical protein HOS56_gp21 [Vibrio phage VEN]AUG87690.1 hypothetical protein [Vibrio phage VEN]